ncbi:MAG: hypothetical protein KBT21_07645 [Treponema sp.]|nr:hypothetical protein [Candidatus Treponema merdequi]
MKIIIQKIIGIVLKVIGVIAAILVLMTVVFSIVAHVKYSKFYSLRTKEAKNPGMWDDYVPQGITYIDGQDYYVTCGYMKDHSASRIYTVKDKNKIKRYRLISGAKDFCGHTGGLQYSNGMFYLASEGEGVYKFSADQLENNVIEIGTVTKVNNNSSFCFSDDKFLYVGEYAHSPKYKCNHTFTFNGKTNTAIMSKYDLSDLTKPVAVYSIPDEVQGVGVTCDGDMIFSRSWALSFSSYDTYKQEDIVKTDFTMDNAPVYFLSEPSSSLQTILFSEDVDLAGDKLISMTEAGANMYYIGKFIFDFDIYSFNINELKNLK